MTMPDAAAQFDAWMQAAIEQAREAERLDDVLIGAVVVRDGEIIAAAHNRRIIDKDPTAHAEMLAIRQAAETLGDWRLNGCDIVVTLEPCCMCAGAIVLARLDRLIYGADDPKAGAVRSRYALCTDPWVNHHPDIHSGLRADECGSLLTDFFRRQRAMGKK